MKRSAAALLAAFVSVAAMLPPVASAAADSACPSSRAYLEPKLKTTPADGKFYRIQRESIQMPIDDVIALLGGVDETYAIAKATRTAAVTRIASGAKGAERRFHEDTILRADALIEILDCRRGRMT